MNQYASLLRHLVAAAAALSTFVDFVSALRPAASNTACRFLPDDRQWPSSDAWKRLNKAVGGRLIAGKPLAHACHGADYNVVACADLRQGWTDPPRYFVDTVNIMSPYWLNNSCSPFTSRNASCILGNIAPYAINVSNADDVAAWIRFAKQNNIRLTIKNMGHDFLGWSTGQGSLSLWTHNLKSISFSNYSSSHYKGPAIKLGAGMQAFDAYPAAAAHGLRVTGGFCPTVGIVGGYVQGGGHGPLAGKYGLAADNTLELEVVTGDGRHLVTDPTRNPDLFWALNGGGGGTYAVVLSQTTPAHPDGIMAGASLTFNNTSDNAYWAAIEAWQKLLLDLDKVPGASTFWGFTNVTFALYSATLPDADANANTLAALLNPFVKRLTSFHLPRTYKTNSEPTYYDHFARYNPQPPLRRIQHQLDPRRPPHPSLHHPNCPPRPAHHLPQHHHTPHHRLNRPPLNPHQRHRLQRLARHPPRVQQRPPGLARLALLAQHGRVLRPVTRRHHYRATSAGECH